MFSFLIGLGVSIKIDYSEFMFKRLKGFQKGHKEFRKSFLKGRKQSQKERKNHSIAALKAGIGKWMLGKKASEASKEKKRGPNNKNWKGGKYIDKNGYVYILQPNHPNANLKGYVFEHRFIMEKHLGRILGKKEFVHHKNGIKNDNRLENLSVVLPTTHFGEIVCPYCQNKFLIK